MEKSDFVGVGQEVLVVEDNELNMKLFNDLLEAHGYRVVQARTGPEALAAARESLPDLILMDIQLPEISGLQVTQEILKDDGARRHSDHRRHRFRHERRRRTNPRRRLPRLYRQADIGRRVS